MCGDLLPAEGRTLEDALTLGERPTLMPVDLLPDDLVDLMPEDDLVRPPEEP